MMLCIRSGVKVCSKCTLYFFGEVHSKKFLSGTLFWAKKIIHLAPRGICEKIVSRYPAFLSNAGYFEILFLHRPSHQQF